MAGPTVSKGISAQILSNIPAQWNAQWFREFCLNYLANADTRNAAAGSGITIAGSIGTSATLSVNSEVLALFAEPYVLVGSPVAGATLTGYRSIAAQAGVLSLTDGGATSTVTVGVTANGIGNAQLRQSAAVSVVGNATSAAANVADIVASAGLQVLQTNSAGTALTFGSVPAAALAPIASDTVLGNVEGTSAAPTALTAAELTSLINQATESTSGAIPALTGSNAQYLDGTGAFSTPTGTAAGANPSAIVGLAAVDGSALTFMRSDAAPALDQTISPTWTGNHVFSPSSGTSRGTVFNGLANSNVATIVGSATSGESYGLTVEAGTNSTDNAIYVANVTRSAVFLEIFGDGHGTLGASSSAGLSWTSTGNFTLASGNTLTITGSSAGTAYLAINGSATTGTATATGLSSITNKPGSTASVVDWLPILIGGTTRYIPIWG